MTSNRPQSCVTIDDLSNEQIEFIFTVADRYLQKLSRAGSDCQLTGKYQPAKGNNAAGKILATLFFEPSTRTRFSFESAMLRLGGEVLSSVDPAKTSSSKGESLADTIRVMQAYSDLVVLRHPKEGAARLAANYSDIPIINGGDGSHEHPTQTLCDLYTLRREKGRISGLNVLLYGDLKNGRTIHSLVYALARFGANIMPYAAKGLELPFHVSRRLQVDYNVGSENAKKVFGKIALDAIYTAPKEPRPHQTTLFPEVRVSATVEELEDRIDICYVTRLQKERLEASDKDTVYDRTVNKEFLKETSFKNTSVLHPMPRVDELSNELDTDKRALYFKQAAFGVPVRMALISCLLGLEPGFPARSSSHCTHPTFEINAIDPNIIRCSNQRCITHSASDEQYLKHTFSVVQVSPFILRCAFCEHEETAHVFGDAYLKKYYTNPTHMHDLKEPVFFVSEREADAAGFSKGFKKAHHSSKANKVEGSVLETANI